MSRFSLTPQQLNFMRTFGYLHLPGLMRGAMPTISVAFDRMLRDHGGDSYTTEHRLTVPGGFNRSEELCQAILDAEPIDGLLTSLLGADYQYWASELSYCGGDTPWHSDSPLHPEWRMPDWHQIFIYPDALGATDGALRVIPGSHRFSDRYAGDICRGILDEDQTGWIDPTGSWGVAGPDLPSVTLASQPGDVIVINYMTAHASFGGADRRRLLTAKFFPRLGGEGLDLLHRLIRRRGLTKRNLLGDGAPLIRSAPSRRLSHLEQLLEHTPDDAPSLHRLLGLVG
jgi:hypothetical protein